MEPKPPQKMTASKPRLRLHYAFHTACYIFLPPYLKNYGHCTLYSVQYSLEEGFVLYMDKDNIFH